MMSSHPTVAVTAAPHPRQSAAVLQAALQSLLADDQRALPARRKASNWRTRRIVEEIRALASPAATAAYETEMREEIVLQEYRLRARLMHMALRDECLVEECATLRRRETQARATIDAELVATLGAAMNRMSVIGHEDAERRKIWFEQLFCMRALRQRCQLSLLAVDEARRRQGLVQLERLSASELQQRRLLEVGQELQLELLKQTQGKRLCWVQRRAMAYQAGIHAVLRAEERDRRVLVSLSLLHLTVLYSEAEGGLAQVLRGAAQAAWLRRQHRESQLQHDCVVPERLQRLQHQEQELRALIEDNEAEEQQAVHTDFVLGWRAVYDKVAHVAEWTRLVAHLELYERHCIHDQARHAWCALLADFGDGQRAIVARERPVRRLQEDYLAGRVALQTQEHAQFVELHRRFYFAVATTRALEASLVLAHDERRTRYGVMGEEVRRRLQLCARHLLLQCASNAMAAARRLAADENAAWGELMALHALRARHIPCERLVAEEAATREAIEAAEAMAACATLQHTAREVRYRCAVSQGSVMLVQRERLRRAELHVAEREGRMALQRTQVTRHEHALRALWARYERLVRGDLRWDWLRTTESLTRQTLCGRDYERACTALRLDEICAREGLERERLRQAEQARRAFLAGSVPYAAAPLRACEVDELARRLHIMTEAELTVNACARRFANDAGLGASRQTPAVVAAVRYGSEALWARQAEHHFLSMAELCEDYRTTLVVQLEPRARHALELTVECDLRLMHLCLLELRIRDALCQLETRQRGELGGLQARCLRRQASFDARALPPCDETRSAAAQLELFLQQPHGSEDGAGQVRGAVQDVLRAFLCDLYWSRNALFINEELARMALLAGAMQMTAAPRRAASAALTLSLHSIVLPRWPHRTPHVLQLWECHAEDAVQGCALSCAQTLHVAGDVMQVWRPNEMAEVCLARWGVDQALRTFCVLVVDRSGDKLTAATLSVRAADFHGGPHCLSLPLNDCQGQLFVTLHVE